MAKLYIFHRNGRSEFQLADHNVVGRHPKNRIKIPEPGVSKVHCLISRDAVGAFTIRDLGSRNGTFVNGKRISGITDLADGCEVLIGNTRCLFREEVAASVVSLEEDPEVISRIRQKISPLRLNKFFPEANIIDEEMLRTDYERLRISFELSRDIGFDFHVDFILGRVLDRARDVLDFDYGAVFLENDEGVLKPQSYKLKGLEDRITVPVDLLDYVRDEQKGVLLNDAPCDPLTASGLFIDQEICSMMAVPIIFQLDFLGIVVVAKTAIARTFNERDLHLLSNVANKTAMFIRNSQIAKRVNRESIERERFRQIVSPDLAEMIVSKQLKVERKGIVRNATSMVVCIRNHSPLSEFSDPESTLASLNAALEVITGPIFRLEGMVDRCLGDRVLAIWGIPVAHDDDAVRTVRAAMEICRSMEEFNRRLAHGKAGPVEVGVGIDTGAIVAGNIGAGWSRRYSFIGEIADSAEALASSAAAGQVVISENTFFIIRQLFDVAALEGIDFRGGVCSRYAVVAERPSSSQVPWTYLG
ncbi:MAG: FHA domain-containing protein [Desulfobacterales bacterium]